MIKFTRAYVDSQDHVHASLESAQEAEILYILAGDESDRTSDMKRLAHDIVENKDTIIDALTMNDSSRPGARGQKKPRKSKPSESQLPLKENAA